MPGTGAQMGRVVLDFLAHEPLALVDERDHELAAPIAEWLDVDRVIAEILAHAGRALFRMHEFIMRRIEAVLDRTLVVIIDVENDELVGAPRRIRVFRNLIQRRSLLGGQIAEEREHDVVFFLHRVAVDLGPRRRLLPVAERRDQHALPVAVELPAMIRTLDAVLPDCALAERAAPVDTGIGQHPRLAG